MTRNEWIAQVVLREIASEGIDSAIAGAVLCADALEAANVAPWKDAAPQARATIAYEVEDGVHIAGHLWPKTGDAAFTRRAVAAINAACNAPALTDTAAKVVEATEAWLVQYESDPIDEFASADCRLALAAAVRAHLAAKQGGAS